MQQTPHLILRLICCVNVCQHVSTCCSRGWEMRVNAGCDLVVRVISGAGGEGEYEGWSREQTSDEQEEKTLLVSSSSSTTTSLTQSLLLLL